LTIIEDVVIRKILDSRGNPTVEVEIYTPDGFGSAMAPSGASTGAHEVKAFPSGGVDDSIAIFRSEVADELAGMDAAYQSDIDELLHSIDGTSDFSRLGGNAAVAASLAAANAAANSLGIPLYRHIGGLASRRRMPLPLGNVLGGGRHAVGGTDIQEFLVMASDGNPSKTVFANALVHKRVGALLKENLPGSAIGKGDEGAWVASVSNEDALELVSRACGDISDGTGLALRPALDVAASELYSAEDGKYTYRDRSISPGEQIDYMARLVETYNLCLIEDPLDQDDFQGYAELTGKVGGRCVVVGDDLFVTNPERIAHGISMGACNSVLIKPNQIGTLTRTLEAVDMAHRAGYTTVVSHRSGETTDPSIAHIAVAVGALAIKTGSVGGERTAKLNELIRIEDDIQGGIENE